MRSAIRRAAALAAFVLGFGVSAAAGEALPAEGPRVEAPKAPEGSFIFYHGLIASVDTRTGDLVLMGNREDLSEDVIVKMKADPENIEVVNQKNQDLRFADLARGDQIDADCRFENDTLFVETIFLYGTKSTEEDPQEKD